MNNRAALVDTWRLIEFNANALKSDLSLTFSGDIRSTANEPFRFRAPNGSLQVGVQFDGPFTRLLERNNYRQALIDYQQDRRQLIQFEDNVNRTLRATLRRLEQLRENLEIQRRAVAFAVRRVDETRERLNEPPPVGQPRQLPPVFDLLTALSDLRNTQNNFMSVWLNYYAARMLLYRELGIMELDDRGIWIDRPLDEYRCDGCDGCPLPPDVPQQWIIDANQPARPAEQVQPPRHLRRPADTRPARALDGAPRRPRSGAPSRSPWRRAPPSQQCTGRQRSNRQRLSQPRTWRRLSPVRQPTWSTPRSERLAGS